MDSEQQAVFEALAQWRHAPPPKDIREYQALEQRLFLLFPDNPAEAFRLWLQAMGPAPKRASSQGEGASTL